MKKIFLLLIALMSLTASTVSAQTVYGAELESIAVAKIESILDDRGDFRRREITFNRSLYDMEVPDGILEIVPSMSGNINLTSYTPMTLRVMVDGRTLKVINFVVSVRIYDVVLVTNHELRFDEPISESDFRLEEIAIDGRAEPLKDYNQIKGLVPVRMIRAGSPVTSSMFQTPLVIEVNQPVRILTRYHGIEVVAKGVALGRGRIGKVIRVRNEASGKILSGRVIDSETVEVTF
ncbi:MAG: flagellar basal body P-ring formation protein FlgA [Selenomonadaceae bacterium]|nr:flagellar basal body P-ring formation protein FlgA [Selenomonadaceae bacterium]